MARKYKIAGKRRRARRSRVRRPGLAKTVRTLVRKVRNLDPEVKYVDSEGDIGANNLGTQIITPWTNVISQGLLDIGERVGDKIRIRSCRIRMIPEIGAGYAPQRVRVVMAILRDNPLHLIGGASNLTDSLFQGTLLGTVQATQSFYNWDNHRAYTVVYDKTRIIYPNNAVATGTSSQNTYGRWDVTLRLPPARRTVQFSGGADLPVKNELMVFFISDFNNTVTFTWSIRTTYTDC